MTGSPKPPSTLSRVSLHPASLKHLSKGNPWITADSFTAKFPLKERFLAGIDHKGQDVALLLNDPNHKNVKARLWSHQRDLEAEVRKFPNELKIRIARSFDKRLALLQSGERENICLIFEEADQLPGLQVQLLKNRLFIQSYASYWEPLKKNLVPALLEAYKALTLEVPSLEAIDAVYFQPRLSSTELRRETWFKRQGVADQVLIQEFGVNYELRFQDSYDIGMYTDMSAIRAKVRSWFANQRVLNLFSYTGAFSLLALKEGASKVTSVDLSRPNQEWLSSNLDHNPELAKERHESVSMGVERFVKKALDHEFDVIIVDPPSASSDGKKKINALQQYEKIMPDLYRLAAPKAKFLFCLNTHSVTFSKFDSKMREILGKEKLKITQVMSNQDDYAPLKNLPESRHLKVVIAQKN
jgi:23S rRNA (cytosine1962-C5)-methyltransferase